jgi:hypothetical protein
MTWKDLITQAYRRRRIITRAGAGISTSELNDGLAILNEILDEWQTQRKYSYDASFGLFTLTPNHQPTLMGPTAIAPDFTVAQRPVKILGADLVLNTSNPAIDLPMNIRDDDWWLNQRVKSMTSNVPTDLYPSYDIPNISLYFWPVPKFAYGVRIEALVSVPQVTNTAATVSLPQGFAKALELSLAEELPADIEMPMGLPAKANGARVSIQTLNIRSPRIASADYGTRGRGGRRGDFDYYSGGPARN